MIRLKVHLDGLTNVISLLNTVQWHGEENSISKAVAFNVLADMRYRIQIQGKAADGSIIGNYSKKAGYFPPVGRPLGKPFGGKNGQKRRSTFASGEKKGQDHKTRYFPNGYFEWKTAVGANTLGTVNLTLTGTMLNSMSIFPTSKGWGIGWANDKYTKRARWFEEKYDKSIFGASTEELSSSRAEIKRLLKNAFPQRTN
jgi:hypothetical protein